MELWLKIDQDERSEFFELYDTLSPLRKKIWNKVVQKARHYKICNFSQSKLADWCDCSRSAISEAFKLFKEWGWLWLKSRGWKRTKTINIPLSKKQIDVTNRQYFKRVEATYRATHTYSKYKSNTSRPGEIKIPDYLRKKDIPIEAKLKLSLVSEHIYQEAYYQCQKKCKNGWKPNDPIAYFVGTAMRMAEKSGIFVDYGRVKREAMRHAR